VIKPADWERLIECRERSGTVEISPLGIDMVESEIFDGRLRLAA
jgi:hypothetical protein